MTNTEIAAANKIMLGTTEVAAMYIGSMLIWQNTGQFPSSANNFTAGSTISS